MNQSQVPPPVRRSMPTKYIIIAVSVILGAVGFAWLVAGLGSTWPAPAVSTPQVSESTITPEQEAFDVIYEDSVPAGVPEVYVNEETFDNTCFQLYVEPSTHVHEANIKYVAAEYSVQAFQEGTYKSSEVEGVPFETFVESIDTHWCQSVW